MEISSSSDNLSEDNSNGNNSSENNSSGKNNNDNSNSANNGNNETVIVEDTIEVHVEMTPVVMSAPAEQPDVYMGSPAPPPPPQSQVGAAAQILSEHLLSSLGGRTLRLVEHVTNGRRHLDNIVRKEALKAQRPQRDAKADRHKNLPQVLPRQPPRKPLGTRFFSTFVLYIVMVTLVSMVG